MQSRTNTQKRTIEPYRINTKRSAQCQQKFTSRITFESSRSVRNRIESSIQSLFPSHPQERERRPGIGCSRDPHFPSHMISFRLPLIPNNRIIIQQSSSYGLITLGLNCGDQPQQPVPPRTQAYLVQFIKSKVAQTHRENDAHIPDTDDTTTPTFSHEGLREKVSRNQ